mmetsp:Transcript_68010/g.171489  ORF Transcript_68010/g.171489 Transcript_68010/m.171489 type:complete len:400 (-) Transcript_68010:59-1258(-)
MGGPRGLQRRRDLPVRVHRLLPVSGGFDCSVCNHSSCARGGAGGGGDGAGMDFNASAGAAAGAAAGRHLHSLLSGRVPLFEAFQQEAHRAAPVITDTTLPVICPNVVHQDKHLPLVVPLGQIVDGRSWHTTVLAGAEQRPLLEASLVEVPLSPSSSPRSRSRVGSLLGKVGLRHRSMKRVEVTLSGSNRLLAAVDSTMQIMIPAAGGTELVPICKLDRFTRSRYVLTEQTGRPPRWSMSVAPDGGLRVFWFSEGAPRPSGGQEPSPTERLEMGQDLLGRQKMFITGEADGKAAPRGQLIASAVRAKPLVPERLEVLSLPGVDAVLVILCMLGVLAFDPHAGGPPPKGTPGTSTRAAAAQPPRSGGPPTPEASSPALGQWNTTTGGSKSKSQFKLRKACM